MSNLWHGLRCRIMLAHKWEQKRIEGETVFECRWCHKRYFGSEPPEGDARVFSGQ